MVYFNIMGLSSEAVVACFMFEVNFVKFLSFSCCKTAFSGIVQISKPVVVIIGDSGTYGGWGALWAMI